MPAGESNPQIFLEHFLQFTFQRLEIRERVEKFNPNFCALLSTLRNYLTQFQVDRHTEQPPPDKRFQFIICTTHAPLTQPKPPTATEQLTSKLQREVDTSKAQT